MDYAGAGKRWMYIRKNAFKNTNIVPPRTLSGFDAMTLVDVTLRFGPGAEYAAFDDEILPSGTQVSVFFEENGWVFSEFMTAQGLPRGWIETGAVHHAGM